MPNTPLKELYNLYRYIQLLILESQFDYDDEEFDNRLDEGNWLLQTRGKYMKFVMYHSSPAIEPRNTSNQKLVSFRKGIKREEIVYPTLKDERHSDSFSRSLYITAKSHECEDVLDPEYTPSNSEKDLFEAKQVFMFSVLDKHLLSDMGKTIVRKYMHTTDAQSVWKDFQEHMKSSSKGASEKRRLTQYVTSTVLDDNYKGTTEQFVLHFNEQFRQLEEVMNFIISTPINLAHLCLLDMKLQPRLLSTNPNTKPNTFPKKSARQNELVIYIYQHIDTNT